MACILLVPVKVMGRSGWSWPGRHCDLTTHPLKEAGALVLLSLQETTGHQGTRQGELPIILPRGPAVLRDEMVEFRQKTSAEGIFRDWRTNAVGGRIRRNVSEPKVERSMAGIAERNGWHEPLANMSCRKLSRACCSTFHDGLRSTLALAVSGRWWRTSKGTSAGAVTPAVSVGWRTVWDRSVAG
jgi:hypothetical protein